MTTKPAMIAPEEMAEHIQDLLDSLLSIEVESTPAVRVAIYQAMLLSCLVRKLEDVRAELGDISFSIIHINDNDNE